MTLYRQLANGTLERLHADPVRADGQPSKGKGTGRTRQHNGRYRNGFCEAVAGSNYAADEEEFLRACDQYRTKSRKRFLLACDYLTVLKEMGYHK